MSLPIISADQRLAEQRGIKGCIFGKSGIGKTSLLWTLNASTTLFMDLKAGDLAIEGFVKLQCGVAEVRLHPLTLGDAHLADPAVLKQRQRRQQDQQRGGQDGQRGRPNDLHERSLACESLRKILQIKLLHS